MPETTAQPQPQQYDAPAMPLPRALIFFASFWLIGSWVLAMGVRTPVHPNSASFTPGVRLMMLCIAVGLMVGWPLMRLSQSAARWPLRQTLLDLIVLLMLVQVVIWPMRLVTVWSPLRTAAIDAAMASWLVVIGAIVASAIGVDRPGPRVLAMLACLGVCVLGPVITFLGLITGADWMALVDLSPFMAVHTLGLGGSTPPAPEQWHLITLLAIAGGAMWIVLGLVTVMRSASGTDAATTD